MASAGHWTTDATWQDIVSSLRSLPGGLRYAELCGGIGAPTFAIKALDIPAQLIGHWDTEERYQTFLHKFNGDHDNIFVGEQGNVFTMDTTMLATCHCIVSGPPCPPWSNIGLRAGNEDIRSCVFWAVCDHIINAARNGVLIFFVLENVPGLDTYGSADRRETPAMRIITYLQDELGSGWGIDKTVMNTSDFGLPQRRKRLYIIGRRMTSYPLGCPSPCPVFKQPGHSCDILDLSDKDMPIRVFTPIQLANINEFQCLHRTFMIDETYRGMVAFVDHSRSPTGRTAWGRACRTTRIHADLCETLTASGPAIYVFSLGEGMGPRCVSGHQPLRVDRELFAHERGALQGFPADACRFFGEQRISKQAFGNAMSVPVVGMAIARELSALLNQNGSAALEKMFESGPSYRPVCCTRRIFFEESDIEDNMDVEMDMVPNLADVFFPVLVEWHYGYSYISTVMVVSWYHGILLVACVQSRSMATTAAVLVPVWTGRSRPKKSSRTARNPVPTNRHQSQGRPCSAHLEQLVGIKLVMRRLRW